MSKLLTGRPMRLVGIAGCAHSGKDTVCSILTDGYFQGFGRAAFADPLKKMLAVMGVDCSDEMKDKIDPYYGKTPRYMMQTLGTQWGRGMIGENVWIKAFARRNAGLSIVVPDVRYENEAALIREFGVMIHITGRGGIDGDHDSENTLPVDILDLVIDNSGTIEDLHASIDYRAIGDRLHAATTVGWLPF